MFYLADSFIDSTELLLILFFKVSECKHPGFILDAYISLFCTQEKNNFTKNTLLIVIVNCASFLLDNSLQL